MVIVSDPIGDLLTRMRNAQRARRAVCRAPWSKIKVQLLELLKREGYVSEVKVVGDEPKLEVEVTFSKDHPALEVKRVSKPGRRLYVSAADAHQVKNGLGARLISTPKGVLSDAEARKVRAGGENLFEVW